MSCSTHAPKGAMAGSMVNVTLSRPPRASAPSAAPRASPGSSAPGSRQACGHRHGLVEERVQGHPLEGRRGQPDVRQGAVPPAHVRRIEEDRAVRLAMGEVVQAVAGVGDDGEVLAGRVAGEAPVALRLELPEVGLEAGRLDRRARLAGDDVERRAGIAGDGRGVHGGWVGRVQDLDGDAVRGGRPDPRDDPRRERAAAHAADQRAAAALGTKAVGQPHQLGDAVAEVEGQVEPAQPLEDGRLHVRVRRPHRRVAVPDAADPALGHGTVRGRRHRCRRRRVEAAQEQGLPCVRHEHLRPRRAALHGPATGPTPRPWSSRRGRPGRRPRRAAP